VSTKFNYGKVLALLFMATSLPSAQVPDAQLAEIHKVTHAKHALIEKATENLDPKNRATVEELYDAVMGVNHVVKIPDGFKKTLKGPLSMQSWRIGAKQSRELTRMTA
jgi:hypothetical protein